MGASTYPSERSLDGQPGEFFLPTKRPRVPVPMTEDRPPHRPMRREYSPISGRSDVDQSERTLEFKMALYAIPGLFLGGVGGGAYAHPILGAALGFGAMYGVVRLIVGGAGRAAGVLHNPSGRTTPHENEHSMAQSLLVRGLYDEAIDAYENAVAEDPTDAVPYVRLARLHRDQMSDPETALNWFKRALAQANVPARQAGLLRREVVELIVHGIGEPRRAAPLLARWAEEFSGSEEGEWAAARLTEIKATMS